MKATSLIAGLLIAASLSAASLTAQAEDSPQKPWSLRTSIPGT